MKNVLDADVKVILRINVVIIIVGFVGNIFSYVIFSRKCFKRTSIAFYCKSLAIFDFFSIAQLCLDLGGLITNKDLYHTTQGCKVALIFNMVFSPMPAWILVFFSIDQMLDVCRFSRIIELIRKRSFQIALISTTLIFHVLVYLPIPFLLKSTNITFIIAETNFTESEKCDLKNKTLRPFSIIYLFVDNFIPFVALMVTTSVIFKCLYKSRQNLMMSTTAAREPKERRQRRDRKFGVSSVTLNILFIVLTYPVNFSFMFPNDNFCLDWFIKSVCMLFFYANYSLHFCTHLCVNSLFRKEFMQLIGYSSKAVSSRTIMNSKPAADNEMVRFKKDDTTSDITSNSLLLNTNNK